MNNQNTHQPLTCKEILNDIDGMNINAQERISRIIKEFSDGLKFIEKYPKSVTFFGSARFNDDNVHYVQAMELAKMVSKRLGYAVITGGGGGIMEAGNRGAKESGGKSIGFLIQLPREQTKNPYLTDYVDFHYFFSRKVALTFSAEAYIFFPGGFGTLNEFFEIVTLVQTRKIPKVPMVLIGTDFWLPLQQIMKDNLLEKHNAISKEDLSLYTITDDLEQAFEIIKNAPLRKED